MKKKKDEELAQATGSVKKGRDRAAVLARNTTGTTTRNDDTVSEDCSNNNPMSAGRDIRSTIASPKPLSEQEQQQKDKAASAAARDETKAKYIAKYQRDLKIMKNQYDRFGQIFTKIDKYVQERDNLPKDADGVYFIVQGMARIVNQHDGNDYGGQKLNITDYFGTSKYILMQGFSYFGDIIAHKEQVPVKEARNTRTR